MSNDDKDKYGIGIYSRNADHLLMIGDLNRRQNSMTIEQYYRWINTKAGKKIKDFMNRLIPGLMPEPVPVRVPVRQEDRYNRR